MCVQCAPSTPYGIRDIWHLNSGRRRKVFAVHCGNSRRDAMPRRKRKPTANRRRQNLYVLLKSSSGKSESVSSLAHRHHLVATLRRQPKNGNPFWKIERKRLVRIRRRSAYACSNKKGIYFATKMAPKRIW